MDVLDPPDATLAALTDGLYAGVEEDVQAESGGNGACAATTLIALSSVVQAYVSMRIDGNFLAAIDETRGTPRHEAIIERVIGADPAAIAAGG